MNQSYEFPADFMWGAATASYQIEGAADEGGRGPSVWDHFCKELNGVMTGESGDVACDFYHRWREDIALMQELGIKHFRFSLAWPRIFPEGTGTPNEAGLAFYDAVIDGLLAAGITPHITCFHWDSPLALETRYGSWRSRQIADDFADYVAVVVRRYGDRVRHWMTINEVPCFTALGYGVGKQGVHAPGTIVGSQKEVWQTVHHAMLAHGKAVQVIRAISPQPCQVSLVDNCSVPMPVMESPEHIQAAQIAFQDAWCNGAVSYPALTGDYSPLFRRRKEAEGAMPDIAPGDLETIHQPLDAYGLNIYSGGYVRAAANADGYEDLPLPQGYPRLDMPWLNIAPDAIYWAVRHLSADTGFKGNFFIAENGCAAQDQINAQGEVLDLDRLLFIKQYLRQTQRLIAEGYPVNGYFVWSLLDNFEWAWGYAKRFGIVYTVYESQRRIPKQSAHWYRECIKQNRVV
ncbi:MAG: beta-glucosidase [Planctomycetota bacterium]|nr:MAG: beta-glucosidase [Planctomycetota bacterium]